MKPLLRIFILMVLIMGRNPLYSAAIAEDQSKQKEENKADNTPLSLKGLWIGTWVRLEISEDGSFFSPANPEKASITRKGTDLVLSTFAERKDVKATVMESKHARMMKIGDHDTLYYVDPVSWSKKELQGAWAYELMGDKVHPEDELFRGVRREDGTYVYMFYYLNRKMKSYNIHYDRGRWEVNAKGQLKEILPKLPGEEEPFDVEIQMIRKGDGWNSWVLLSSERKGLIEEGMKLVVDRKATIDETFVVIPTDYSQVMFESE